MKENARKLLAKVGIMRSFPNGKRSVNAGIHAIFLDSAVFTVLENTGTEMSAKARFSLVNCGELEVFPSENSG